MREVMIALAVISMFGFAFYVAVRIGGFLETNYRGAGPQQDEDQSVSVTFAAGKNALKKAVQNLRGVYDRCAVIVCDSEGAELMDDIDPEYRIGESQFKIG